MNFEQYMQEKHAEQFIGTKDCMVDDFAGWLEDLNSDEWLEYEEAYHNEVLAGKDKEIEELVEALKTIRLLSTMGITEVAETMEQALKHRGE